MNERWDSIIPTFPVGKGLQTTQTTQTRETTQTIQTRGVIMSRVSTHRQQHIHIMNDRHVGPPEPWKVDQKPLEARRRLPGGSGVRV